jgi:hypothetical protein
MIVLEILKFDLNIETVILFNPNCLLNCNTKFPMTLDRASSMYSFRILFLSSLEAPHLHNLKCLKIWKSIQCS